MIKEVEVNGMRKTLLNEKEIEIFERTYEKIKSVEECLTTMYINFEGDEITYEFGTDKRNIDSNFALKFIFRDDLQIVELSTTYSNQYITDEFIELLELLNEIKKEGI